MELASVEGRDWVDRVARSEAWEKRARALTWSDRRVWEMAMLRHLR